VNFTAKTVITGAAGLVGQNLCLLLREAGHDGLVAIDRHPGNLEVLADLNPGVSTILGDCAEPGAWEHELNGAGAAVLLHAQVTSRDPSSFFRNNVEATRRACRALRAARVPFTVLVSSSVVNSVADDAYARTKRVQEAIFRESALPGCVLRPTLMYGWFDPKHLGWLARFMEIAPVFPLPGDGRFPRQPLYARDFCRVIAWCLEHKPIGRTFDLAGAERVDFVEIVRAIRDAKRLRRPIVPLPLGLFAGLLRTYARLSARPPFTADQLAALTTGEAFSGVDLERTFGFAPTPLRDGIGETFRHPVYSRYRVNRF
jgi:uncharacterized protein YbjT (DUF2867 family)